MEKDFGKIKKNENTDIVIRVDDFGGKIGLTIREFTSSDRYTGFTKSGTRIPAESFQEFKKIINTVDEKLFDTPPADSSPEKKSESKSTTKHDKKQKTISSEIEEEIF